jgi:Protein kinase domain
MSTDNICPQCHTKLPPDAPAGLCPRCLIRSAAGLGVPPRDVDFPDIGDPADVASRLPQFEIIELLGQGGMGVVYKARQPALDRLVALKILPPAEAQSPDFVERFRREARALAKLSHPNIVAVHECGEAGGLYYFVMEFVDGANLRALLQDRRLTPAEALAIVPHVCDALEYAHEEGVIHRDIKPENLLIDKKGRVKIADFGLAKLLRREPLDVTLTATGIQLGTLRYMAPEQMEKPETVDHRADIYSLGVVIYEMLTGEVPMGRFAPPSERARVDVRLDEIVLRTLERDVERRYQHASEVKTDVENVTATAVPPRQHKANAGTNAGHLFRIQTIARNAKDIWLALALAPVVVGLYGFLPGWLASVLFKAATGSASTAVSVGWICGISVFIALFLLLGSGSVSSVRVSHDGLMIHRYIGPSRFLPWSRVRGIEPMTVGEVFRHIWIWPGIPPRGSVISMSAQGFYRISCDGDCWYFNPRDAQEFLDAVANSKQGEPSAGPEAEPSAAVSPPLEATPGGAWVIFRLVTLLAALTGAALVAAPWQSFEIRGAFTQGNRVEWFLSPGYETNLGIWTCILFLFAFVTTLAGFKTKRVFVPAIALIAAIAAAVLLANYGWHPPRVEHKEVGAVGAKISDVQIFGITTAWGRVGTYVKLGRMEYWQVLTPAFWAGVICALLAIIAATLDSVLPRRVAAAGATAPPEKVVRAPGEALVLLGCVSLLAAFGVALWRALAALPGAFREAPAMAITLAGHGLWIGAAGWLMSRLRKRMLVLGLLVLAGLFLPVVIAVNVVMELAHIPQWPVIIPLWLAMPACVWAVVLLFRDDVREAFAAKNAEHIARAIEARASLATRGPRLSRSALIGTVWAAFGILAVVPVLYFVALNRVWNGTALPTDIIHSVPPAAFTNFMGALLFIGAGAPIGSTILGAISVGNIKRSGGNVFGLPLAAVSLLCFPLILVGTLAFWLTHLVQIALWTGIHTAYTYKADELAGVIAPPPHSYPGLSFLVLDSTIALVVCFFGARVVWRKISGVEPQAKAPGTPGAWTRLEITAIATTTLAFVLGGVNALFGLGKNSSPLSGATLAAISLAAACTAALLIAQQFRPATTPARAALPELAFPALAACAGGLSWTWVLGDSAGWNFWHGAGFAALNFVVALFLLVATGTNIPRTRAVVVLFTGLAGLALILWWNAVPVTLIGDRGGFLGAGSGPMTINRKSALAGVWLAAALALLTAITGALRLRAVIGRN